MLVYLLSAALLYLPKLPFIINVQPQEGLI